MSEIPKQIKVGGEYLAIFEEDLEGRYGLYSGDQEVIKIEKSLPFKRKIRILLHEILHHIDYVYGLNISHRAIYTLAYSLLSIIYDNPELLKLLDIYCKTTYNYYDVKFKIIEAIENVTGKR